VPRVAVRLGEAARDREAEARAVAVERLEDPLELLRAEAGACVEHLEPEPVAAYLDAAGRELERVLDQVREHPLDLGGVDLDRRQVVLELDVDAVGAGEPVERLSDELVHRPELGTRCRGARLEARQVEQVRDEALQPPALEPDRLEQAGSVVLVEREPGVLEPVHRRRDRRQGRAEVV
jgi:hypothetical protein